MTRNVLIAAVTLALLAGCATTSESKYSVTPQTQVSVKSPKKKSAQANYRVSPEDSKVTGSGGSAK